MKKAPTKMAKKAPTKMAKKAPTKFNAKLRKAKADGKLSPEFASVVKMKNYRKENDVVTRQTSR